MIWEATPLTQGTVNTEKQLQPAAGRLANLMIRIRGQCLRRSEFLSCDPLLLAPGQPAGDWPVARLRGP